MGRGPEPQGRGEKRESDGAGSEGCGAEEEQEGDPSRAGLEGDRCESRNSSSEWPGSGWVPRGPGAWSSGVSPEGNEMLMFLEHGLDGILCFYHVRDRFL